MEDVKVECAAVEGADSEEASDSPADVRRRSVMQDEKIVQLAMHGRRELRRLHGLLRELSPGPLAP